MLIRLAVCDVPGRWVLYCMGRANNTGLVVGVRWRGGRGGFCSLLIMDVSEVDSI